MMMGMILMMLRKSWNSAPSETKYGKMQSLIDMEKMKKLIIIAHLIQRHSQASVSLEAVALERQLPLFNLHRERNLSDKQKTYNNVTQHF